MRIYVNKSKDKVRYTVGMGLGDVCFGFYLKTHTAVKTEAELFSDFLWYEVGSDTLNGFTEVTPEQLEEMLK